MAFVNLLEIIYPVGSVYLSTVSTSPSSTIGGTWVAMTGGMLGLAGSIGVADAASDGGSRKISSNQMPEHSHQLQAGQQGGSAGWDNSGGADRLQYQRLQPGRHIFEFYSRYTTSVGGGRIIFLLIPLFTVGEELLNLLGGEQ